jgi:epoxyqueuosine reductase QueG
LTTRIADVAFELGAHLIGVAPICRFDGAPRGHHPTDLLPDCKSVVVVGGRLLDRGLEHFRILEHGGAEFLPDEHVRDVMQDYWWETQSHGVVSDLLSAVAFRVALKLQDAGFGAVHIRSSNEDLYGSRHLAGKLVPCRALFSHRHAAVRAGLGEFGLNNLVITPEYGPRVRWASVLTAAPLDPSPLLQEKTCLGVTCSLCVSHCGPVGVVTLPPAIENDKVWLNTVGVTNTQLCLEYSRATYCKGQCQRSCPVGVRV